MTMRSSDRGMWESAQETGCPFQRYLGGYPGLELGVGVWVAQATPPCKKKTCGQIGCHNFGKVFEPYHDRFWIIDPTPVTRGDE